MPGWGRYDFKLIVDVVIEGSAFALLPVDLERPPDLGEHLVERYFRI